MIRKTPCVSVIAVRTCSMSAGLLTSTWTPGSTAPDVSLTTPAMLLCADAAAGSRSTANDDATTSSTTRLRITKPPRRVSIDRQAGGAELFGHRSHRCRLREPRRLDRGVRLDVGQDDVRLHVCLRHLAIERHFHAGDVAVIGEIDLRRDEAHGRARPPHEA